MKNSLIIISILSFIIIAIYGCAGVEKYGAPILNRKLTKIKYIQKDPDLYQGKTVTVEGSIISECPTGCWFNLKDETGVIYVDLEPTGLAIPQKLWHKILVEGKVKVRRERVLIVGSGVEIR